VLTEPYPPSLVEGGKLSVFSPSIKVMVDANTARNLGNTAPLKNRMIAAGESGFGHVLGRDSIRSIRAGEDSAG